MACQAVGPNTIFTELARRLPLNMGEYMDASERYPRLAPKAQNQCRLTLETIASSKNPPVIFAKQANINHGNGNQQVNNGTSVPVTRAEKTINQQNELIEVLNGSETMDSRATGATSGKDKAMATVEQINGGAYTSR